MTKIKKIHMKKIKRIALITGGAKRIGETMGKTPAEGKQLREMFL